MTWPNAFTAALKRLSGFAAPAFFRKSRNPNGGISHTAGTTNSLPLIDGRSPWEARALTLHNRSRTEEVSA